MRKNSLIFVDTSFIVAFVNKKDQWHPKTHTIADEIESEEKIISNLVISETLTLLGKRFGGKIIKPVYNNMKDNYIIFDETRKLYDNSVNTQLKYDGTISLADSVSVEIMKELKINKIVSFDSDFDKVDKINRIY